MKCTFDISLNDVTSSLVPEQIIHQIIAYKTYRKLIKMFLVVVVNIILAHKKLSSVGDNYTVKMIGYTLKWQIDACFIVPRFLLNPQAIE